MNGGSFGEIPSVIAKRVGAIHTIFAVNVQDIDAVDLPGRNADQGIRRFAPPVLDNARVTARVFVSVERQRLFVILGRKRLRPTREYRETEFRGVYQGSLYGRARACFLLFNIRSGCKMSI